MSRSCGYRWFAPRLEPRAGGSARLAGSDQQYCCLDKDHDGDHRSVSKVTAKNNKVKEK